MLGGGGSKPFLSLYYGFEWLFYKGNGLNVSLPSFKPLYYFSILDLRYVYETQNTSLKYALLTGFELGGFLYHGIAGRYNIGLRLRKKKHAVLFDVNIPLHNVNYVYSFYPIYPGITIGVSYVFFFGVKNDFYL